MVSDNEETAVAAQCSIHVGAINDHIHVEKASEHHKGLCGPIARCAQTASNKK
jgi:hypothetical protein